MTGQVFCRVLPFPERLIHGRLNDRRAERLRPFEMFIDVINMNHDVLADFAGTWKMKDAAEMSQHDRTVADVQLSVCNLPIPIRRAQSLVEPERPD